MWARARATVASPWERPGRLQGRPSTGPPPGPDILRVRTVPQSMRSSTAPETPRRKLEDILRFTKLFDALATRYLAGEADGLLDILVAMERSP